jgi:hypothetical protein
VSAAAAAPRKDQDDDEKPEHVSAADLDALRGDLHAMLNAATPSASRVYSKP